MTVAPVLPAPKWETAYGQLLDDGELSSSPCRPRPGTPTDQAWIESLNGHLKYEYPHLLAIRDPATLRAELAVVRRHYNTIRLHAGVGYVTPDDEHTGRGEAIRKACEAGLEQARLNRLARHRAEREGEPRSGPGHAG